MAFKETGESKGNALTKTQKKDVETRNICAWHDKLGYLVGGFLFMSQ